MPRIGPFGIWELLIILFVLLLFFGSSRLPGMARGIAESIGEFRKGIRGGQDDDESTEEPRKASENVDAAKARGSEADVSSAQESSAAAQRSPAKTGSDSEDNDREGSEGGSGPEVERRTVVQGQE